MCADMFVDRGQHGSVYCCGDIYSYHQNKLQFPTDGSCVHYLRCTNHGLQHCGGTARLRVFNGDVVWLNGQPHRCGGDPLAHGERVMLNELMLACEENPYENPRQLLNRIASRYPVEVASRVRLSRVRWAMRRARLRLYPNIPNTLYELGELLGDANYELLTSTLDGLDNLYAGIVGGPGERSLVLVSQRMLQFLERSREVLVDGTFVPAPVHPYSQQVWQMVTVVRNRNVIPILLAVMESRTAVAYRAVLQHVKAIAPLFHPDKVIMDYERAQVLSWHEEFDNCTIVCCYVHFFRSAMKNGGRFGVIRLMRRNPRIKRIVRSLLAVPLLPKELMRRGCRIVMDHAARQGFLPALNPFFQYFVRTWMRGWRHEVLSVYGERDRTNNACESANRLLRAETGAHHPNIWTFLNGVRNFEQSSYTAAYAFESGRAVGARRRIAVVLNDEAIVNFSEDLLS